MDLPATIRIAHRFRGPPSSGNGGYTCGLVARAIDGPAEVTLEAPPPLDQPLTLAVAEGGVALYDGDRRIARAKAATIDVEPPRPPTFDEAASAVPKYVGFQRHDYPTCFVCGPARATPDALALHPGPIEGRSIVAAPWEPDGAFLDPRGTVRPEIVWAALDCPSFFGHSSFEAVEEAVLLGRLTAEILEPPSAGERCVVVGWSLGRRGRKIHGASAVYGAHGKLRARAEAIWICVARS